MCDPYMPNLISNSKNKDNFLPDVNNMNQLENTQNDNEVSESLSISLNDFESVSDCNIENEVSGEKDPILILNELKTKNTERLIVGHININFLQNKFEYLKSLIQGKIDIIVITETKIDDSFPLSQFTMDGYSIPFRLHRDSQGGGIIIYIREDIPCKELKTPKLPKDIEGIFIELNLRKTKWLLMGAYNPQKGLISYFLHHVGIELDKFIGNYDNILLLGDFNSTMNEEAMKFFCEIYHLKNLINEPTCYKSAKNPSSIDVILTNRKRCFQDSITVETGLSDHHKLTVTVLKTYFKKKEPTFINYRSYKHFHEPSFRSDLLQNLNTYNMETMDYDEFKNVFMQTLNKHAPMKEKVVRGNNAPFMNKTLSKAFMNRAKLKNNFNKNPTEENKQLYKKQRNFCVRLLRKEKKEYYNNLDLNIFSDNKKFWKCIKPLFSDKQKFLQKEIILVQNDTVTSDKTEVAEKFNNYFIEAVENLDIETYVPISTDFVSPENIPEIIKAYDSHPSILKIKEHVIIENKFLFNEMTSLEFQDEILNLDPKKSTAENDIPTKVLITTRDIVSDSLTNIYNDSKNQSSFPKSLKLADVMPIHKKDDKTDVTNYRPVSLLPTVSKLFERNMYNQIQTYIEKFLSPYLFGFRRGHSTEQCLLIMLETWKRALDRKQYAGAILTDLSKAFDCLNHNLLVAKLAAYGFDHSSLKFIYSYLKERKQRTKINSSFSSWRELNYGVPQGSILGPLLFNIFLNDIFFFPNRNKVANYADDNTPYSIDTDMESLLNTLEDDTSVLLNWFRINDMKPNDDKCHLLIANEVDKYVMVGNEKIKGSSTVELLGVKIDNKLNFSEHVSKLCKKGNQKLHALARIAKYMSKDKLRIVMKTFIQSQFNYCPLIWMFHNRTLNNKINKLHERALRIVYNNSVNTFQELLDMDNSVTIHHRNLQKLAVEMYKFKNNLSSPLMQDLFTINNNIHDVRNERCWENPKVRTVSYGTETIRYRGPKVWDNLPKDIKESSSLNEFKENIKKWKPMGCTCRLCKIFIPDLGFIN